MQPKLRRIWLRVHSWLGLGFGAILATTRAGFVFRNEFSALAAAVGGCSFHQDVPPSAPRAGATCLLDGMLEATHRTFPGACVTYVVFPQAENGAFQFHVKFPVETHQNGRSAVIWLARQRASSG